MTTAGSSPSLLVVGDGGWLRASAPGQNVVLLPSVRTCPLGSQGLLGLVWHGTGGTCGPGFAEGLARRVQTFSKGDRPASWHVLVGKDGTLYQSVPFTRGAWHVGLTGIIAGQRVSINRATVGVELENAGELRRIGDSFYTWPYVEPSTNDADPKLRIGPERVVRRGLTWFDGYPQAQIDAAELLVRSLARAWIWSSSNFDHAHADFAAPRKTDPGTLWTCDILPALLARVFSDTEEPVPRPEAHPAAAEEGTASPFTLDTSAIVTTREPS